ncbi:MAG: Pirin domain protein [Parcubacteria group bacterium GW2011_GWA2_47_7]|nr:MAG: Pirin domain protein [Parcubacteria group bacterium GW2011_GWA2_47_7]
MRKIERSEERGESNLGWLQSRFTYSFADYVNHERMGFGALRVVNDDTIAPESGFPLHHHEQMEIVTIMLEGVLTHTDSLGNKRELRAGEVQTMTAGTGVSHSEWNNDKTTPVRLLQIWVYPKERTLLPRYEQHPFEESERKNVFQILAWGVKKEGVLFIHQDATFARACIATGESIPYQLTNSQHGLFIFVISGKVSIGNDIILSRDSIEVTDEEMVSFRAEEEADVLIIEVPLFA